MTRFSVFALAATATLTLTLAACSADADEAASTPSSAAPSAAVSTADHDLAATNTAIMERFTTEFLPAGDPQLAEEFLDPNIIINFGGPQQQGRDTYLAAVAANNAAFPDLRWTVEEMVAQDDTVAVRYTMNATHEGTFAGVPATGRPITAQSIALYRLDDGRIVEERAQLDLLSIFQQMGAVTLPGA